jgi:hypothetical protein
MRQITFRDSELARRWKEEGAILLGPDGPSSLGRLILRENGSVSEVALKWGLGEDTPYFWEAVSAWAIPWALRGGAAGLDRLVHVLLPWASRQPYSQLWKEAIGKVILEERFSQEGHDQDRLKAFVLSAEGLGDPRLPLNRARWNGVPDSARFRVLQWLTKADLGLFFETLLPRGKDPHNRKPFWLRYLDSVISSRPLLTRSDLGRVTEAFRGKEDELQHVGRVDQTLPCSAFILLFRDVLIVEFTTQGCAYFYTGEKRRQIESIMWEGRWFSNWELKSTQKADINIPHSRRWEEKMESALANYGIRPKGGNYSRWGHL